jgi:hypothetical protein
MNGLAFTTTATAYNNDDHTMLEMVSKGAAISPQRRRWNPEYHKRVYTVEIAEQFREHLEEGQPRNEDEWNRALAAGRLHESWQKWWREKLDAARKAAKKAKQDPPGDLWHPLPSPVMEVDVQIINDVLPEGFSDLM